MEATTTTTTADSGASTDTSTKSVDSKDTSQAKEGEASTQEQELDDTYHDRLVKLKVNGEEKKVTLREILKNAQISDAASKKLEQAKAEKQQAFQLKNELTQLAHIAKTNPRKFMEYVGIDPYEFSEATLSEKVKMMEMSPEARRAMEAEEKLKKYEEQEKERAERETLNKEQQEVVKWTQSLDVEIAEAWKDSGLPSDKFYVQQIAAEMLGNERRRQTAIENNEEPEPELNAKQCAAIIKDKYFSHLSSTLPRLELNQLKQLLGADVLKALREDSINQVRTKDTTVKKSTDIPSSKPREKKVFHSEKEFREWQDSLKQ